MFTYIIHRLLIMIPTLIAISVITFLIIQLPEGDYLSNLVQELQAQGEAAALEKVEFAAQAVRPRSAGDHPVRHVDGLLARTDRFDGLLQGNWGHAFEEDIPVSDVVGDRLFPR